jgi:hypothetical protein
MWKRGTKLLGTIAYNVLQLPEGGDFEALHCQPSTNFDRSTKPDLTTEPPLLGRCCYVPYFFVFLSFEVENNWKNKGYNYCPNAVNR